MTRTIHKLKAKVERREQLRIVPFNGAYKCWRYMYFKLLNHMQAQFEKLCASDEERSELKLFKLSFTVVSKVD